MQKTVNNEHGTFQYDTTTLEDFVEQLAGEVFNLKILDLEPAQSVSYGPYLKRRGQGEFRSAQSVSSCGVSVSYIRNFAESLREGITHILRNSANPMPDVSNKLYADKNPREESLIIGIHNQAIEIVYKPGKSLTVSGPYIAQVEPVIAKKKCEVEFLKGLNGDGSPAEKEKFALQQCFSYVRQYVRELLPR